jgi:FkbM family methyltransferase
MVTPLRQIAGRVKRRLFPPPTPADEPGRLFRGKPAVLVKIGAHDGVQNDPLRKLIVANPQWTVLFIEPVKAIYDRLLQNYPSGRSYRFENIAIADQPGTRPFYYVSDEITTAIANVPWWYDELGSFDRNHIIKHDPIFEPFIVAENIRCDTLAAVLARQGLTAGVDFIHIDTEGYDYQILKQIDFSPHRLRAILYENKHLTNSDTAAAEALLEAAGYRIKQLGADTLAIRRR